LSEGSDDEGTETTFSGSSDQSAPFPNALADIPRKPSDWDRWLIKAISCSTAEFLCRRIVLSRRGDENEVQDILAVPRIVAPGREYTMGNLRIETRAVGNLGKDGPRRIRVTIWRSSDGVDLPTVLMLEEGRGVIYWDGLRFNASAHGGGQLCALRLGDGIFSNIRIRGQ
jgi:hypothetical protein